MINMNKKPLVVLTGPTAVGKTDLSIKLAKLIGADIISADSMQVYKYMNIGTAKITKEEMDGVKHYLVDVIEPKDGFDVVTFQAMAKNAIEEIYANNRIPMIVGGTGFYIQAVLNDIDFDDNDADLSYRNELNEIANIKGAEYLHDMLKKVDEKAAKEIHSNNVKRVIRALEFYKKTGSKISEHNEEQHKKESPYNFHYFVLTNNRDVMYERINKRVDIMLDNGLLDEVKALVDMGLIQSDVAMQGIGYKEVFDYFDGKLSYDELSERIKQDTRHFAKRQLTWFRREPSVDWVDLSMYDSKDAALDYMVSKLKEKSIIYETYI